MQSSDPSCNFSVIPCNLAWSKIEKPIQAFFCKLFVAVPGERTQIPSIYYLCPLQGCGKGGKALKN